MVQAGTGRTKGLLYHCPRVLEAWFWSKPNRSRFLHGLLFRAWEAEEKDREIEAKTVLKRQYPRSTTQKKPRSEQSNGIYTPLPVPEKPVWMGDSLDVFESLEMDRLKKAQSSQEKGEKNG